MSLPRPSGIKAPSKIGRPSGLPAVTAAATPPPAKTGIPSGIPGSKAQSPESDGGAASTDDFKIGDRVWVSGTKPGIIAFIGDTQFAPGEWAGVVLDEAIGKNDGCVMGVRYFQCEMKRGVFSRLTKLSRSQEKPSDSASDTASTHSAQNVGATNGVVTSPRERPTTPRLGLGGSHAPSGSSSSLHKASPSTSTSNLHSPTPSPSNAAAARAGLKIGDRVLVSGSKPGILKYVGETDFAKGVWAGVELDEALGKNDGAVAGKRYFDCKPMHGLFAPVHKVARLAGAMSMSTPSPQSRSVGMGLRSARERSGSQESVSSISSSASSVSRSRTNKAGQRPSTLNLSATTAALQKALKEKEEHIEQLLRERDLERSEVARAAAQVDDAETQLTVLRTEQDRVRGSTETLVAQLKAQITELEREKETLATKLEDEKRKVEDLQFQIEEEVICKDDLETTKEEDEMRMRDMEKSLNREKARAAEMEKELQALRVSTEKMQSKIKDSNSTHSQYLDQIEELTHKLTQAENRIKQFESTRMEDGAKSSQIGMELAEKNSKISELEELTSSQCKELKHAQDQLQEVREELAASNSRCKKLQDSVNELTNKVQNMDASHNKIDEELRSSKSHVSDLQRQLSANKEKTAELTDERSRVEQQLADLMKNSGDSSKQLSTLNEQLAERTRRLEELQNDLSNSSQQIAKLNETIDELQHNKEKEKEEIVNKHEEQLKSVQSQLEDMQIELEKSRNKLTKVTEEAEQERSEVLGRKDAEIQQLKQKLETQTEELSKQELQTQAHKQYLDKVTLDLEAMKYEKEKAEKAVKRVEGERDTVNMELIQVKVDLSKMQSLSAEFNKMQTTFKEQIEDLQADKERALQSKQEAEKQRDDVKGDKEKTTQERDQAHQELVFLKAEMQKREIQMDEMKKEMDRLRQQTEEKQEALMQRSQTEADMLTEELQGSKKVLQETQHSLKEKEAELTKLRAELELAKRGGEERHKLEEQKAALLKEVDKLKENHRQEMAALDVEKAELSSMMDNSAQEMDHQRKLVKENQSKVTSLEAEKQQLTAAMAELESRERSKEAERKKLQERLSQMEASLLQAEKMSVTATQPVHAQQAGGEAGDGPVLKEKDAVEPQVEFLNSVIVDLQRKNKEMEARLEAMESGALNGSAEAEPLAGPGSRSRPAPRLFCDICDVFDLHDTDDCPKQAMSDSPPPSLHHGDRKSVRPYCEICEYFVDPQAVDQHSHSKLIDSFFQQCIGFSDEDLDEDFVKRNYGHDAAHGPQRSSAASSHSGGSKPSQHVSSHTGQSPEAEHLQHALSYIVGKSGSRHPQHSGVDEVAIKHHTGGFEGSGAGHPGSELSQNSWLEPDTWLSGKGHPDHPLDHAATGIVNNTGGSLNEGVNYDDDENDYPVAGTPEYELHRASPCIVLSEAESEPSSPEFEPYSPLSRAYLHGDSPLMRTQPDCPTTHPDSPMTLAESLATQAASSPASQLHTTDSRQASVVAGTPEKSEEHEKSDLPTEEEDPVVSETGSSESSQKSVSEQGSSQDLSGNTTGSRSSSNDPEDFSDAAEPAAQPEPAEPPFLRRQQNLSASATKSQGDGDPEAGAFLNCVESLPPAKCAVSSRLNIDGSKSETSVDFQTAAEPTTSDSAESGCPGKARGGPNTRTSTGAAENLECKGSGKPEQDKGSRQAKTDNPDPKGEKQEKVQKRENQQEKQDKAKKRASAGASLGGAGTGGANTPEGTASGSDRPESCVVS